MRRLNLELLNGLKWSSAINNSTTVVAHCSLSVVYMFFVEAMVAMNVFILYDLTQANVP